MNKAIVPGFAALVMLAALPAQADHHCTPLRVNLTIKPNELVVAPPMAKCVETDSHFTIYVRPQGAGTDRTITVHEKEGVPLRIRGNNEVNRDRVLVTVEGDGDPSKNYGYIIEVSDHGMLDPEVRVVSSRLLMLTSELGGVNAVLEEQMGFGVDELNEKQAELRRLSEQAK